MSTWNCFLPSTPSQTSTFEKKSQQGFGSSSTSLFLSSPWGDGAEPASEPAPALGLPVHGRLALLQRLLQLCQLAAAHFQPLPGRQERKVSRTQQNSNLYKSSLNFQGRSHQTQAAAVTFALQLLHLRISLELLATANPQLPQAELPFPSRAGKGEQLSGEVTDINLLQRSGILEGSTILHIMTQPVLTLKDLNTPPYNLDPFKRVISTWSHINMP